MSLTPEDLDRTIQQVYDAPLVIVHRQTKARYFEALKRLRRYQTELANLGRHQHLRRYRLQRKHGHKRRHLLLPRALEYRLRRVEWAHTNWKHRHDPEW